MSESVKKPSFWKRVTARSEFSIFVGLVGICVIMSFLSPYFLKIDNLFNILNQISRYGIIATGMALIIISGGIDLSVGYVAGLTACLCAYFCSAWNLPAVLAFFATIFVGLVIGLVNGILVTHVRLVPFIVTMAMGKILSGCTLLLTGGRPIKFVSSLSWLGKGYLGPIPVSVIVMLLCIFAGTIFSEHTVTGRNIYAIGNNERTAKLSGINVQKLKTLTYVITSGLCALCGVIIAGNLQSADASLGTGFETETIAAVVIGGVAMSGGEGTIWGSLIGASIIGILKNAFVLLRISAYWQSIVIGIVILAAVTIDKIRTSSHKN